MSKTKTPALAADQFDGSNLETLAFADGLGMVAVEAIAVDMVQWKAAGLYPTVTAVAEHLSAGYARAAEQAAVMATGGTSVKFKAPTAETLKQYASGILKWARAGKFPKDAQSPRAFTASVPEAKDSRGRKAGAKTETKTETDAPAGVAETPKTETKTGARPVWRDYTPQINALIAAAVVLPVKDGARPCRPLMRRW